MLRSSAGSNPAGSRTVASLKISSIGGRACAIALDIRGRGLTTTAARSMLIGSIVAKAVEAALACRGSHLRITLALMRWLSAIAETDAPGTRHCATTSRLNWSA